MIRTLAFVMLAWFVPACLSETKGEAASAFEQFKSLAGDWEGTYEWTGARNTAGSLSATYYLTGNGSALVENLIMEGVPSMTSVYHLDGIDLRMTHYCAAQNQPRLKAGRIDPVQGAIDFAFVDITNLRAPDAPHVRGLEMRIIDSNHLTLTFLFQGGNKESRERIVLKRIEKASGNG